MSARRKSSSGFGMGFLRPFGAVLVLSAFILSITFTVRGISQLKMQDVVARAKPLLARVNVKLPDNKLGQVAGTMISRFQNVDLGGGGSSVRVPATPTPTVDESTVPVDSVKKEVSRVVLMADVHSEYANLTKALKMTKDMGISNLLFLGDFTSLGLVDDLVQAKKIMDDSGIKYAAIAGDHDLWKSVGFDNFIQVFGKNNQIVTINGIKFVLLDNSANYTVIPEETITWFKKELSDADFVIVSQPLYYPRLDRYMGRVNGEDVVDVLAQRDALLTLIRDSNVKAVIAADLHTSDSVVDPTKDNLKHILIGALTSERNLQTPRFSIMNYFEDGSYELQDVVLE